MIERASDRTNESTKKAYRFQQGRVVEQRFRDVMDTSTNIESLMQSFAFFLLSVSSSRERIVQ